LITAAGHHSKAGDTSSLLVALSQILLQIHLHQHYIIVSVVELLSINSCVLYSRRLWGLQSTRNEANSLLKRITFLFGSGRQKSSRALTATETASIVAVTDFLSSLAQQSRAVVSDHSIGEAKSEETDSIAPMTVENDECASDSETSSCYADADGVAVGIVTTPAVAPSHSIRAPPSPHRAWREIRQCDATAHAEQSSSCTRSDEGFRTPISLTAGLSRFSTACYGSKLVCDHVHLDEAAKNGCEADAIDVGRSRVLLFRRASVCYWN
jgi:hypothetical protein